MRIGIDARLYKEGLGIGRYIEQLLSQLEQIDTDNDYFIFLRKGMMDSYRPKNGRFHAVCVDIPWYSIEEQLKTPFIFSAYKLDLMHFPHFNVPLLYCKKFVVTIHDLLMMKHKDSSRSAASSRNPLIHWVKYQCYEFIIRSACRRAHAIITVSYSTKNDLMNILAVHGDKIRVIYEGVQHFNARAPSSLPHSIRHPYYLNVGNAYPHKNIQLLLNVFSELKLRGMHYMLLLCGQEDYFRIRLLRTITDLGLDDVVMHLGYVTDEQLALLYAGARAAVFPSFEEGFGFGALEAAFVGTPVIVSDIPCFRETLGKAALYIDPMDPTAMIGAIMKLEADPHLRNGMIRCGLERVKLFSWRRAAEETLLIYRNSTT